MFYNRIDAGQQLGRELKTCELRDPLVLAIPRGGIVTGAAIAREIGAELDVVLAHKLRAPFQHELAIGAIGEDGKMYLNEKITKSIAISDEYLESERRRQIEEISRRQKLFRSARPQAPIRDRSVIITDDGIATGSTMFAAMEVVKAQQPSELIIAIPVAPPTHLEAMRRRCDELICLQAPVNFMAVGQFYQCFDQVSDAEVVEMLREFAPTEQAKQ